MPGKARLAAGHAWPPGTNARICAISAPPRPGQPSATRTARLLLLAVGALVATGRLHGRRKAPVPAGGGQPGKPEKKKDGWAARVLAEPRLGLAMLVGALVGIPGAAYLSALHNLVTGKSSTATQVLAVIIFVLIEFSLIIVPFVFLQLRPEATKAALKNAQDWLLSHARKLMAYTALILGAYLVISAVIRLS